MSTLVDRYSQERDAPHLKILLRLLNINVLAVALGA